MDHFSGGVMQPLCLLVEELHTVAADWWLLMLRLGLEQWQLKAIDRDHPTVREKLTTALDVWLQSSRNVSWLDIVHALRGMEEKVLASVIDTKYCQLGQGTIVSSRHPGVSIALQHRPRNEGLRTIVDLPTGKLLEKNRWKMRVKFFGLVAHVSLTLSQRMSMQLDKQSGTETFQQFREYVAGMCSDGIVQSKITVGEILGVIRDKKYWDLDGDPYDLLLSIVEGTNDAELKASIEKGQEDYYTQYLVAAKVADFMLKYEAKDEESSPVEYRPNFAQLSLKLSKVNVNECSMAYLTDLWKAVKRCVHLPNLFSVLASIEKGCLRVTWHVPTYAVPALAKLPRSSPEFFEKFSIVRMTINGVCFYQEIPNVATSTAVDLNHGSDDPNSTSALLSQEQPPLDSKYPVAQSGYEVDLVRTTEAYECRVCFIIPKDPMQVSCCGKRFCRACISRVLAEKNVCPHCQAKSDTIQVFEDEGQRQAILELSVYCPNKERGCGWIGELCHQDTHLNLNPPKGFETRGCQFVDSACIHCSECHPRSHMRSCPLQCYTCPYCKCYSASYREVTSQHVLQCEQFLVPCPCCDKKVARNNLSVHKTVCLASSQSSTPVTSSSTTDVVSNAFVSPPSLVMKNFTHFQTSGDLWFSVPFYSHIGGYKMCLRVDAYGGGSGTGTHLSAGVQLMRGEYDDDLQWPFRGDVTFRLVNQRVNEGHVEVTILFDDSVPDRVSSRVTEGERAIAGRGSSQFVPSSALLPDESWNTEYLKKDTLEFQVTQVKLAKPHSQPSSNTSSHPQLQLIPPVTINMSSFISWKLRGFPWHSQPFYSHSGGYKMCLRVVANGLGKVMGKQLSVFVYLLCGEHDDNLAWPFRGSIALQLVNHRANQGHVEFTVHFNDSVPDKIAGRVTEGPRPPGGWGYSRFVSHSSLRYNETKNTEYLKNDTLVFRVIQVQVFSQQARIP